MNDDQKRAWRDARRDFIYEDAAKKLNVRTTAWRVFWVLTILKLGYEFFSVEVFDEL